MYLYIVLPLPALSELFMDSSTYMYMYMTTVKIENNFIKPAITLFPYVKVSCFPYLQVSYTQHSLETQLINYTYTVQLYIIYNFILLPWRLQCQQREHVLSRAQLVATKVTKPDACIHVWNIPNGLSKSQRPIFKDPFL